MRKISAAIFATFMLFSIPFVAGSVASGESSVNAQSVAKRTKRKGKYVYRRTWDGTKWTTRKVRVGTRPARKKTWRTGRKVVSRSKKVIF
jgi:hypothetical protein